MAIEVGNGLDAFDGEVDGDDHLDGGDAMFGADGYDDGWDGSDAIINAWDVDAAGFDAHDVVGMDVDTIMGFEAGDVLDLSDMVDAGGYATADVVFAQNGDHIDVLVGGHLIAEIFTTLNPTDFIIGDHGNVIV